MANERARNLVDAKLTATNALPAAGASANGTSIDLGNGPLSPESIELEGSIPATPSLVDAKTIIIKLQDSADNSSFADIAACGAITIATGAGGVGAAAAKTRWRLPSNARRYVRQVATVLASGGDNTAVSTTLSVML
jgi:hypothetical protein